MAGGVVGYVKGGAEVRVVYVFNYRCDEEDDDLEAFRVFHVDSVEVGLVDGEFAEAFEEGDADVGFFAFLFVHDVRGSPGHVEDHVLAEFVLALEGKGDLGGCEGGGGVVLGAVEGG